MPRSINLKVCLRLPAIPLSPSSLAANVDSFCRRFNLQPSAATFVAIVVLFSCPRRIRYVELFSVTRKCYDYLISFLTEYCWKIKLSAICITIFIKKSNLVYDISSANIIRNDSLFSSSKNNRFSLVNFVCPCWRFVFSMSSPRGGAEFTEASKFDASKRRPLFATTILTKEIIAEVRPDWPNDGSVHLAGDLQLLYRSFATFPKGGCVCAGTDESAGVVGMIQCGLDAPWRLSKSLPAPLVVYLTSDRGTLRVVCT